MIRLLIVIFTLFFFNYSFAKDYFVGQEVQGQIEINKKFKIPLSSGKWIVFDKMTDSFANVRVKTTSFALVVDGELMESIEIGESQLGGNYQVYLNDAINESIFLDEHDGCYKRPEYFVVEVYRKGSTHNCMVIAHTDLKKNLYNPDNSSTRIYSATERKWLEDNNIKYPLIALVSAHSHFSRLVGQDWYVMSFLINPKVLNAPEIINFSEETSEFHKLNIDRFPEHKKIMEKWVSISSKRHKEFERMVKTKNKHKLDLAKYIIENDEVIKTNESNLAKDLKVLNELYKSGSLTKEEFEKAKKKVLNQ